MKKIFVILVAIICFGISANAQKYVVYKVNNNGREYSVSNITITKSGNDLYFYENSKEYLHATLGRELETNIYAVVKINGQSNITAGNRVSITSSYISCYQPARNERVTYYFK